MGRLCGLLGIFLVFAAPAFAEDRTIADFYGEYAGSGAIFSQGRPMNRDSYVEIGPEKDGFRLFWNTQSAREGRMDVSRLKVKGAERTFKTSGGHYESVDSGNPMAGERATWAYIKGDSLFMNELVVSADGTFDLTVYERTLMADGKKMKITFTRIADGEITRRAALTLDRVQETGQ